MQLLQTITLTELASRLRDAGLSIGITALKSALNRGFMTGAVFPAYEQGNEANYIILANLVEEWIANNSVDVQPSNDMLEFAAQLEAS